MLHNASLPMMKGAFALFVFCVLHEVASVRISTEQEGGDGTSDGEAASVSSRARVATNTTLGEIRCCCKTGKCSDATGMGDGLTEINTYWGVHCCKPFSNTRVLGRLTGSCDAAPDFLDHYEKFAWKIPAWEGEKLDDQCLLLCDRSTCNGHGHVRRFKAHGWYKQTCECNCEDGWDPAAKCATRKIDGVIGNIYRGLAGVVEPAERVVPTVFFPLNTNKYSADKLITGEYAHCQIEKITLAAKPIEPNPLLPEWAIMKIQDMLRPSGALEPLNAVMHCAIHLHLDKCPPLLLEHNENINAIEWNQMTEDAFRPMKTFQTVDVTGSSYAVPGSSLTAPTRALTVFELLYELFARDPDVETYDVVHKNCCFFARFVASVLLKPDDLQKFETFMQDTKKLDTALNEVLGEWSGIAKGLVHMVASGQGSRPNFETVNMTAVENFKEQPIHYTLNDFK